MSAPNETPTSSSDLLLEIDIQPGDAALLRVISTLHHRNAQVRSLTYDGSNKDPRLWVRVTDGAMRSGHLVGALGRCVEVLSVRRVSTSDGVWA